MFLRWEVPTERILILPSVTLSSKFLCGVSKLFLSSKFSIFIFISIMTIFCELELTVMFQSLNVKANGKESPMITQRWASN